MFAAGSSSNVTVHGHLTNPRRSRRTSSQAVSSTYIELDERGFGRWIAPLTVEHNHMTQSSKDQIAGALHEAKGAIKEKAGAVVSSPGLQAEGKDEHTAGTIQKKIGEIEKVLEK